MATASQKNNRLSGDTTASTTNNLMFPADLLADGNNQLCMTFFINTIKNGKANIKISGGTRAPSNMVTSPYGGIPVIHTDSRGIQRDNGGKKLFSDTYTRSDQSITLPMPRGLRFDLGADWSNIELGAGAMGIDQASDYDKILNNPSAGKEAIKLQAINTVGSIAQAINSKIKGPELAQLATATIANSYAETLFKGIRNREFQFRWMLTPRNEKEAESIDNILRLLRFHMLPEFRDDVGNGNAFLLYPSSVDIVFWHDGEPNQYIPKISTCAITNIQTSFSPDEIIRKTYLGSPTTYDLTITLSELSKLHKGMVGASGTASF